MEHEDATSIKNKMSLQLENDNNDNYTRHHYDLDHIMTSQDRIKPINHLLSYYNITHEKNLNLELRKYRLSITVHVKMQHYQVPQKSLTLRATQ